MDTNMFTIDLLSHVPYSHPRPSPCTWTAVGNTGQDTHAKVVQDYLQVPEDNEKKS